MDTMLKARKTIAESAPSEVTLVRLAQAGDGAAYREIMTRNNRRLYRVARSVLGDDSEAEDVVQETYLTAFQKLAGFRLESSLATWLTRIALNIALQRRRRRRDTVTINATEERENLIMHPAMIAACDPETDTARLQVRALLERAIGNLPEHLRVVFMMRDVEELSIRETSSLLDIKTETVKTRLHRARAALRQNLDRDLVGAVAESFPFAGQRCNRLSDRVMAALRSHHSPPPRGPVPR
jgi:RNA polymerase sigma-70 factor (ECF subfamily)